MDLTRYPEILKDLMDKAVEHLAEKLELPPETAQAAAFIVCEVIRREWAGSDIYFPRGLAYEIEQRDLEMFRLFTGSNQAELAKKYDITLRQVNIRIALIRAAEYERNQLKLFG
jgi:Mor family transcriptional regulator